MPFAYESLVDHDKYDRIIDMFKSQYYELMDQYSSLRNFIDVEYWIEEAQDVRDKLVLFYDTTYLSQASLVELEWERKLRNSRFEKSNGDKFFNNIKWEKDKLNEFWDEVIDKLEHIAVGLQESIDFVPNSKEKQIELLNELRSRIIELERIKGITNSKNKIREGSIKQSIFDRHHFSRYFANTSESERRQIRYQRESALKPDEDELTAICRQLEMYNQEILRIQKISPE
jgi:hypothetical protein